MTPSEHCEQNKAIIRQLPALLRAFDPRAIKALFTEDFQLHESTRPNWPTGHEGAVRLIEMMTSLMPDITITLDDMVAEADKVCVRWRYRGTATGTFDGRAGDGTRYEAVAFAIYRFCDGRIAEDWGTAVPLPVGHPWRTD